MIRIVDTSIVDGASERALEADAIECQLAVVVEIEVE